MILWIVFAVMAAAAVIAPVLALRRGREEAPRVAHDVAVYRDQLVEVDRDLERGVVAPADAEAARAEIQRRILRVSGSGRPSRIRASGRETFPAVALAVLVPVLALGIYLAIGSPNQPGRPFSERMAAMDGSDVEEMVGRLAARLEESPSDIDGWLLLGRSYLVLERYGQAAEAFHRADALATEQGLSGPRRASVAAQRGEALVLANGGAVTADAREAFRVALLHDPKDIRAQYYLGAAEAQAGDAAGAVATWTRLLDDAPADAPWLGSLRAERDALAAEAGVATDGGVTERLAAPPSDPAVRGPTQEDIAAMADLSEEDRQAFIRDRVQSLAERLDEDPQNAEGWVMLSRSYRVLGENGKAVEALARGAAAVPGDVGLQLAYARALIGEDRDRVAPKAALEALDRVLAAMPDNPEALWHLGLAAASRGDVETARRHWTGLLARMEEGSPAAAAVQQRLDALGRE